MQKKHLRRCCSGVVLTCYVFVQRKPEFLIFSALLSLLNDNDQYSAKAIESLLCCVQLADRRVARYVVNSTDFNQQLVRWCGVVYRRACGCRPFFDSLFWFVCCCVQVLGLRKLYECCPSTLDLQVDDTQNSFRTVAEDLPDVEEDPSAARAFTLFFERLDLIDVVVDTTLPEIGQHLCLQFREQFLDTVVSRTHVTRPVREETDYLGGDVVPQVKRALMSMEEKAAKWCTVYIRHMLVAVSSHPLRVSTPGTCAGCLPSDSAVCAAHHC